VSSFDDTDQVVATPIRRSLTRPDLLLGCERAPVVFLGATAMAFALIMQKPLTILAAIVIVAIGIPILRALAKRDPTMYRVYTRHFMYQDEYAVHPSTARQPFAPIPQQRRKGSTK
jgi:type IV secretory pathway TrbD component